MKVENTVTIRNGKIDMFKGTMRLAVDKWGLIQEAGAADWEVKVSAPSRRNNTPALHPILTTYFSAPGRGAFLSRTT
jgi:hypothetical protein